MQYTSMTTAPFQLYIHDVKAGQLNIKFPFYFLPSAITAGNHQETVAFDLTSCTRKFIGEDIGIEITAAISNVEYCIIYIFGFEEEK